MLGANIFGVGARLHARRIDDTLKEFIGSMFVETATGDFADASVPVASVVERWKPEIDACLEAAFYAISTSKRASPGMKTFGFSYSKKGNPYILAALIVCKWFYCRLHRVSIHKNWREALEGSIAKKLWRLIKLVDAVVQIFSFANHLSFFSANATCETFPDLTSRLSGYSYAPRCVLPTPTPTTEGSAPWGSGSGSGSDGGHMEGTDRRRIKGAGGGVSRAEEQLLARQVAWETLQGVLMALSLCCDWRRVGVISKRIVIDLYFRCALFLRKHASVAALSLSLSAAYGSCIVQKYIPEPLLWLVSSKSAVGDLEREEDKGGRDRDGAELRDSDACAICGLQPPEAPHAGECGHACCYYCLHTNVELGRFRCPTCGLALTHCTRFAVSGKS